MSFEDGIDICVLCQVYFREIYSSLDWEDTRVLPHLSLVHCSHFRGYLKHVCTDQRRQWRITCLMPGLSCFHWKIWIEVMPAEGQAGLCSTRLRYVRSYSRTVMEESWRRVRCKPIMYTQEMLSHFPDIKTFNPDNCEVDSVCCSILQMSKLRH